MTREEFEQQYTDNADVTIDILRKLGLYAVPCNCSGEDCSGWQMRNLAHLLVPGTIREVEHIPDDWDWADLEPDLIAEGETELLQKLRAMIEWEAHREADDKNRSA